MKRKPHAKPDHTSKDRATEDQKRTSKRNYKIFVMKTGLRSAKKPPTSQEYASTHGLAARAAEDETVQETNRTKAPATCSPTALEKLMARLHRGQGTESPSEDVQALQRKLEKDLKTASKHASPENAAPATQTLWELPTSRAAFEALVAREVAKALASKAGPTEEQTRGGEGSRSPAVEPDAFAEFYARVKHVDEAQQAAQQAAREGLSVAEQVLRAGAAGSVRPRLAPGATAVSPAARALAEAEAEAAEAEARAAEAAAKVALARAERQRERERVDEVPEQRLSSLGTGSASRRADGRGGAAQLTGWPNHGGQTIGASRLVGRSKRQ